MILYHGSTVVIDKIDLKKSRPNKDFGLAFYLSADKAQAEEMAKFRADFEDAEPIVNAYEFDENLFSTLRYKVFEGYTKEWAQFVYNLVQRPTDVAMALQVLKGRQTLA